MSAAPLPASAPAFRPDYGRVVDLALAYAPLLDADGISFGEVEAAILPLVAGPDWRDVDAARATAAGFIVKAVDAWRIGR